MTCDHGQLEPARKVLNVGGNSKAIPIPACFSGWQHDLLDIDPRGNPDLLCDARELAQTPSRVYDAVYCSHNLEHYYQHDAIRVLTGFRMILKKDGFAFICVPDLLAVMKETLEKGLDIEDVLYESPSGPIRVHDVLYGYRMEMEASGNDFYAHKCGFTKVSLTTMLVANGFPHVFTAEENLSLVAIAFKQPPNECQKKLFGL